MLHDFQSVSTMSVAGEWKTFPSVDVTDVVRLAGVIRRALSGRLGFGPGAVLIAWSQGLAERYAGEGGVVLNLLVIRILLVIDRDLSVHILRQPPSTSTYLPGALKRQAMAFLAPQALTIAHDQEWIQWRAFNEAVLSPGAPHPDRAVFLPRLRAAFEAPCHSLVDLRQRLTVAMLAVVFAGVPGSLSPLVDAGLANDVQRMADLVGQPLRRFLLGPFQGRRRQRIYRALGEAWRASSSHSPAGCLLARAHSAVPTADLAAADLEALLQQLPHWMFTFGGSASLLLGRTVVLLLAQPVLLAQVRAELNAVCGTNGPFTEDQIGRLKLLEACLQETGRLYPPVALTLHHTMVGDVHAGRRLPADTEILQLLGLLQRPLRPSIEASEFQPQRWLEGAGGCPFSNLFLSGARACPGKDLILFVLKTGLAVLLARPQLALPHAVFNGPQWPLCFPDRLIRFAPVS